MSKPSKEQFDVALAEAERLRDLDEDERHIGRCLLYLQRRVEKLERVDEAVRHFLHSGQAQHEQARLVKALDAARDQEREEAGNENPDFGLD